MEPKIGIPKKDLTQSVKNLTVVLSNEMVLYVKTRKFHWNVTGNSFMELHKLFEAQYTDLELKIDEVAERISKLGGKAIGTMKEFIDNSTLKESSANFDQKGMLNELLNDHETVIKHLRELIDETDQKLNDAGTADLYTQIIQAHETQSWMLRKYLN